MILIVILHGHLSGVVKREQFDMFTTCGKSISGQEMASAHAFVNKRVVAKDVATGREAK